MKRIIWSRFLRRWFNRGLTPRAHCTALTRAAKKRVLVRPRLECLEDRTLLSTFVVNSAVDAPGNGKQTGTNTGDLRWAVYEANLPQNAGSTITFDSNLLKTTSTINLIYGELAIEEPMTITNPGGPSTLTISGTGTNPTTGQTVSSRVFDIETPSSLQQVTISGLTIANGNASPNSNGSAGNQGGDIYNGGYLTLTNDVIEDGKASGNLTAGSVPMDGRGGGIYNASNATLVLNATTVQNNTAEGYTNTSVGSNSGNGGNGLGGGIYNDTGGIVTLNAGTEFIDNQALGGATASVSTPTTTIPTGGKGAGGAVYNLGTLTISGASGSLVTFTDNLAQGGKGSDGADTGKGGPGGNGGLAQGGAVFNSGSNGTISDVSFAEFDGNVAQGGAGGKGITGAPGGTNGKGGAGGAGGAGGNAYGGGLYSTHGTLTVDGSQFIADQNNVGNEAKGGNGGHGGHGGTGVSGGGAGGAGGNAGAAQGGGIYNAGGNLTLGAVAADLFTSNLVQSGTGGTGGTGGVGGPKTGAPGGAGGLGSYAYGGAISVVNSSLTVDASTFGGSSSTGASLGNRAVGGVGGKGGNGGNGTTGGTGGMGGNVLGGAIAMTNSSSDPAADQVSDLTLSGDTFTNNTVTSGTGGNAGNAGAGGTGVQGGQGGAAGGGAVAYDILSGSSNNSTNLTVSITNSTFTGNAATTNASGKSGIGFTGTPANGVAGQDAQGGALLVSDGVTSAPTVTIKTSSFTTNKATGGSGGAAGTASGKYGKGGTGSAARGGAIYLASPSQDISTATLTDDTITGNAVLSGTGGKGSPGGNGGTAEGGGIASNDYNLKLSSSSTTSPVGSVSSNSATAGANGTNIGTAGTGGAVRGGGISVNNGSLTLNYMTVTGNKATSGSGDQGGGNAGTANGGGIAATNTTNNTTPVAYQISNSVVTGNTLIQGAAAPGSNAPTGLAGQNQPGRPGGNAGSATNPLAGADGAGVSFVFNTAAAGSSILVNNSNLDGNKGAGGAGGAGGTGGGTGGNGGLGGSAMGGGLFVYNNASLALSFQFENSTASNNQLTAGSGGFGGNTNTNDTQLNNVPGGNGGAGGNAEGGGVFLFAGSTSSFVGVGTGAAIINNVAFDGNTLTAGTGGPGGNGSSNNTAGATTVGTFAQGGQGGTAEGGGLYNNSLNTAGQSFTVSSATLAGNILTAGTGGHGGTGTSANGGPGGNGGNAGNAEGGGLYEGDNTTLTVINSTIGGGGPGDVVLGTPSGPTANYNILVGGNGGNGGNGGTAGGTLSGANGGNGGNGSTLEGAGVYVDSGNDTFYSDTIAGNQAVVAFSNGAGGQPGTGTGTGSSNGSLGNPGTANGGGFYANTGSNNTVGNDILGGAIDDPTTHKLIGGLNNAVSLNSNGTAFMSNPDVWGAFTDKGGNILGNVGSASGFTTSTLTSETAAQVDLGSLQNNGGPTLGAPWSQNASPTLTEALLHTSNTSPFGGSVAIQAGSTALVTSPPFANPPSDQRGDHRENNGTVDVGAFEVQPSSASITFSPSSIPSPITAGTPYDQTITASGGRGTLTLSYTITSGRIPTGLTITTNDSTLTLKGTPTAAGTFTFTVTASDTNGLQVTSSPYTLTVNPSIITLSPSSLPDGVLNTAYNQTITASGGIGVLHLAYNVTSQTTPAALGLTIAISGNNLTITGTPTATGTITFTVTAADNFNDSTQESYSLTVNAVSTSSNITFTPTNATLPTGTVGINYTAQTITATETGGSGNLHLSDSITSGSIPAGLAFTISGNQLTISGTPTASGTVSFTVTAIDLSNGNTATSQVYTLTVNPAITFSPSNATLPAGVVGTPYATQTVSASGGSGSLTLSTNITSATKPGDLGLTFTTSGATLSISGTPTSAGTVTFTVTATDNNTGASETSQTYTLTVNSTSSNITLSPAAGALPGGTLGASYSQTITATATSGGTPTISSSVTSDLGLSFTANGNVLTISGTPTQAGTITFTVTASNSSGSTGPETYTLTIGSSSSSAITFTPVGPTLPAGTVNTTYGPQTITATETGGGTLSLSETVTSGTIPAGMNLSITGNTLTISGTPTQAGSFTFNLTATDTSNSSITATQTYTLTVNSTGSTSITLSPPGGALPSAVVGTPYTTQTITATATSGGVPTVSSSVTSQFGLNFTASGNTLTISGTPNATGTIDFTVTATNSSGSTSQNYTLTITSSGTTITLTPPAGALPQGVVDTPYTTQTIVASGGNGTLHLSFLITSGSVPSGMSFSVSGNVLTISGTPTQAGTVNFTVTGTDTNGDTSGPQNYSLTINPSGVPSGSFTTTTTIIGVQNTYAGFMQEETVTAEVTDSAGIPISQGVIAFQVNNQTVFAPVVNGFATATIDTFVLDFSILGDLLFSHPLTAAYEGSGSFDASSASTTVPAILIDFLITLITQQLAPLNQFQV